MTGKSILLYKRPVCRKHLPDLILSPFLILRKILLSCFSESSFFSVGKSRLNGTDYSGRMTMGDSGRIASADEPGTSPGWQFFTMTKGEPSADPGIEPSDKGSEPGSVPGGSSPSRAELNRNADMLMRKFADSILSFACTYMQNRQDAEEILQDSMIAYLMNAPVFENDAHARAWLLSTARNLCLNRLRYNRYRRHADIDETLSERLAAPSKEDHSFLLDAVRELPENMRESIYLFYWEGYSTSQIAVLLDRRENTVRSDLSRARKRLKNILKEEYDLE